MELTDWIGRTEVLADDITAVPVAAMSALLDRPVERPPAGTEIPALWHWLYFLPLAPQSSLGPDGHPERGGFMPPVPQPRRMWAGSQLSFREPLRVGDSVERRSTIENISQKSGRSGVLVFVKVRHEVHRLATDTGVSETPAFVEHHDIVYRDAPEPGQAQPSPVAAPDGGHWARRVDPDDVMLFRYSALTFNGHRIHYDRQYVTEVEGYPGLVVHGPLIASLLLDELRHQLGDPPLANFEFRAVRPVFDINHFFVCGARSADGKTVELWAKDHEGWLTMRATAVLA